jgi:hypothetical protein
MTDNTSSFDWQWIVPDQLMLVSVTETAHPQQIINFAAEFIRLLEAQPSPHIHVIYDATHVRRLPGLVRDYINAAFELTSLPGHGWSILIGGNPTVMMVLNVYINLNGAKVRVLPTLAAAIAFLRSVDPQLDAILS